MKRLAIFLFFLLTSFATTLQAQKNYFILPYDIFSHNKPAFISLNNGTTIECKIRRISRKKGLIEAIKIKDLQGKKRSIQPEQIAHMYLPTNSLDEWNRTLEQAYDLTTWDRVRLDSDLLKDGYVYFEQADVLIKSKKRKLLMQLLNPAFCSKIRVYHNPLASESVGLAVRGFRVAGGGDRSFYVKKGDQLTMKIKKKNYPAAFVQLFEGCQEFNQVYGERPQWHEFEEHVFEFESRCQ